MIWLEGSMGAFGKVEFAGADRSYEEWVSVSILWT
jgi:hypothetical protein